MHVHARVRYLCQTRHMSRAVPAENLLIIIYKLLCFYILILLCVHFGMIFITIVLVSMRACHFERHAYEKTIFVAISS